MVVILVLLAVWTIASVAMTALWGLAASSTQQTESQHLQPRPSARARLRAVL